MAYQTKTIYDEIAKAERELKRLRDELDEIANDNRSFIKSHDVGDLRENKDEFLARDAREKNARNEYLSQQLYVECLNEMLGNRIRHDLEAVIYSPAFLEKHAGARIEHKKVMKELAALVPDFCEVRAYTEYQIAHIRVWTNKTYNYISFEFSTYITDYSGRLNPEKAGQPHTRLITTTFTRARKACADAAKNRADYLEIERRADEQKKNLAQRKSAGLATISCYINGTR